MSSILSLDAGYGLNEETRFGVLSQADWISECVQHPKRLYFGFEKEDERYVLVRDPDGMVRFLPPRYYLRRYAESGFRWGEARAGAAQLALALLADATDNDSMARKVHQRFLFRHVNGWASTRDWILSQEWICDQALAFAAQLKIDERDEKEDDWLGDGPPIAE